MVILRLLQAEWLMTKHTAIRWLIFLVPVLYPMMVLWYFSQRADQLHIYDGYFSLIAFGLPVGIGLFSALMSGLEEGAGGFYNLLNALSRPKCYIRKLGFIILAMIWIVFGSTSILILGMKKILHIERIQYLIFWQGACWVVGTALILMIFHLILSYAGGMGLSLTVGSAGTLIAAIVGGTIVGDKVWLYIPWAWSMRMIQLPLFYAQPNGLIETEVLKLQLLHSVPAILISTMVMAVLGLIWFHYFQGRKSYE